VLWILFATCASVRAAQAESRHVLLLYSYEREFAPHNAFAGLFRPALSQSSAEPINYIEVSLRPVRLGQGLTEDSIVRDLLERFGGRRLDLVVPIGGPAATFAQKHRDLLFPSTPMLFAAVDQRFVKDAVLTNNDAVVAVTHDPLQMIENILQLLPDTSTVVVVIGASPLEQFWLREVQRGAERFNGRIAFHWTNELSFRQMVKRCAELPPRSAILFAMLSLDASGVPLLEAQTLSELHAAANAPIFGLHSTQLGRGIVGGPLLSLEDLSQNTAKVAVRLLQGEAASSIVTRTLASGVPSFDWRELRRWGIREDRLQPGSVIRFREPALWQRFPRLIAAGFVFVSIQLLLVVGLLTVLVRRRRTERSLRVSEERFRQLSNAAPVMIWVAGPDKRRTDVNRVQLDFTGRPIEAELGDEWSTAVHADDVDACLETYRRAFDRREPFRMEYRVRRHDGEYRWILDTGVPRFAAEGFAGYIGSSIDVTELKLARVALSNLSRNLILAQENERAGIAKELHDDFSQRLMVVTMRLHGLSVTPQRNLDELRTDVAELRDQVADLGSEILRISDQFYLSKLELLGLVASVRCFCQETAATHDVRIDFSHDDIPDNLPKDIALALFRILQGMLGTVVEHSTSRQATVALLCKDDDIRLEVADESIDFDDDSGGTHGLGLLGMQARISVVGGECALESLPNRGTQFRARVPLRRERRG
jgi:PAS domain S-box-containing protein